MHFVFSILRSFGSVMVVQIRRTEVGGERNLFSDQPIRVCICPSTR